MKIAIILIFGIISGVIYLVRSSRSHSHKVHAKKLAAELRKNPSRASSIAEEIMFIYAKFPVHTGQELQSLREMLKSNTAIKNISVLWSGMAGDNQLLIIALMKEAAVRINSRAQAQMEDVWYEFTFLIKQNGDQYEIYSRMYDTLDEKNSINSAAQYWGEILKSAASKQY